jgi:hypothetical protein
VGEDAQDLLDGEHPRQVDVPGREVEPAEQRGAVAVQPLAEQPHLAGVGGDQPEDHVQGGGLAGAVGTEQADDLAGTDPELTPSTAVTAPKRLLTRRTSRIAMRSIVGRHRGARTPIR